MYHCLQLARAIRGEQWLDALNDNNYYNTITILGRINYSYYSHTIYLQYNNTITILRKLIIVLYSFASESF